MVFEWGMSPLGFMALTRSEGEAELASPQTLHDAEHHVKTLLAENYAATTAMVAGARGALDAIAQELIERETISGDRVRRMASDWLATATPQLLVNPNSLRVGIEMAARSGGKCELL
jgi:cell division protease FtsH